MTITLITLKGLTICGQCLDTDRLVHINLYFFFAAGQGPKYSNQYSTKPLSQPGMLPGGATSSPGMMSGPAPGRPPQPGVGNQFARPGVPGPPGNQAYMRGQPPSPRPPMARPTGAPPASVPGYGSNQPLPNPATQQQHSMPPRPPMVNGAPVPSMPSQGPQGMQQPMVNGPHSIPSAQRPPQPGMGVQQRPQVISVIIDNEITPLLAISELRLFW